MAEKVYYLCDPEKNKPCRKTNCKHNPDSLTKRCELTSNIKYAADPTPLTFPEKKGGIIDAGNR